MFIMYKHYINLICLEVYNLVNILYNYNFNSDNINTIVKFNNNIYKRIT